MKYSLIVAQLYQELRPYLLQIGHQTIQLTEALAYEPGGELEDVVVRGRNGREVHILFTPGVLYTRLSKG